MYAIKFAFSARNGSQQTITAHAAHLLITKLRILLQPLFYTKSLSKNKQVSQSKDAEQISQSARFSKLHVGCF